MRTSLQTATKSGVFLLPAGATSNDALVMTSPSRPLPSDFRLAVVGLGLGKRFVRALVESGTQARLTVCDSDESRLQAITQQYPRIAAVCRSLEELLDRERPNAVVLVTPDHLHRPQLEAAVEAGCHVMVTKPLAPNLADARAMVQAAERSGKTVTVAHEARYRSQARAVRRLLAEGCLGRIIHARYDCISDKRAHFRESPWYASSETNRTPMTGTAIHQVDLLRHFFNEPITSVAAFSNHLGGLVFPNDTTNSALFRFASGTIAQVTASYEALDVPRVADGIVPPAADLHIMGSRGTILGGWVSVEGTPGWQPLPSDPDGMQAGVNGCVREFLAALVGAPNEAVSPREAFHSLAACAAADRAAAAGLLIAPESV